MTEQSHDQVEPEVEQALDSWAAAPEQGRAWVGSVAEPGSERMTAVIAASAADSSPTAEPPTEIMAARFEPAPAPPEPPPLSIGGALPPGGADGGWSGTSSSTAAATLAKLAGERPELAIGAALLGGFLLATIIKRIAR